MARYRDKGENCRQINESKFYINITPSSGSIRTSLRNKLFEVCGKYIAKVSNHVSPTLDFNDLFPSTHIRHLLHTEPKRFKLTKE